MDDSFNNDIKRYAHRYLVAPPGLFQDLGNKESEIKKTIESLISPIASGSNWTSAAKAYAAGGFDADLVPRTLRGFMSLVSEHDPIVIIPDKLDYINKSATKDNKSLVEVYLRTVAAVLLRGRCPLVLDIQNEQIKIVEYPAQSLIDWESMDESEDSSLFKYAIFKDSIENPDFDPIDNSNKRSFVCYHYHHLVSGVYTVTTIIDDTDYKGEKRISVTPKYKGKTLNFIPGVAIGSIDNTPDVDTIPLVGIANCTLAIYDLSCMLRHAEKTSAVPTMWITGVEKDQAPSVTGAGVCITLPDYTSKIGYTTTDTTCMTHIKDRMADYYAQAQELGASLLGSTKHGSESGEALRLRQASSTATLKSVVTNVGRGVDHLLKMAGQWIGSAEEISFSPNREFSTFALTANETVALVQSWQAGAISHSTLLENFRKAGMLKAGETVDDEKKTLKIDGEKYEEPVESSKNSQNGLDIAASLPKSNTFDKNI